MSTRSLIAAAVAAGLLVAAAPAAAQTPTDNPAPGAVPGACTDPYKPTSSFTAKAARRASRSRVLRGTAKDRGCGVDRVVVSIARKAHGKCQLVNGKRLARKANCKRRHWTAVKGTTRWTHRLSKKLPAGSYLVRTRVRDFAGNVRNSAARRMRIR